MCKCRPPFLLAMVGVISVAGTMWIARAGELKKPPSSTRAAEKYRRRLGTDNQKIMVKDGKTFVWAGRDHATGEDEWFDFTGTPIPPEHLQFGIGKDRIRSIDDPLFVSPDDPRLMRLPTSPYRPEERPTSADDIMVIGYTAGDDARAYPIALLDGHELVNDRIGGKPVTVGW